VGGAPPRVDSDFRECLIDRIASRLALGLILIAGALWSGCAAGVTGVASNVTAGSVEVRGVVGTTTGGEVEYWFEYGPDTGYGSETAHQTATVAAGDTETVLGILSPLEEATSYHYRLCARDSEQGDASGCGADRTVTTQSVDCGDTITTDIKLTGPLNCGAEPGGGLVIGAAGVDINLGGYEFNGHPISVGIRNEGHDDVTIRNGGMFGWSTAIATSDASRNRINYIETSTISVGGGTDNAIRHSRGRFFIGSDGMVLADSVAIAGFGARSSPAVIVSSDDGRIIGNEVQGGPFEPGVLIQGSGNRILRNELQGSTRGCIAISSGAGNVVRDNTVHDCLADLAGGETGDGILVAAGTTGTLLRDNISNGNGDDGIEVRSGSARLLQNSASANADFGIDAAPGVTDLGGNFAFENGNPLQCRNVFCG
jgi:parallel beta-helix repeat protein